MIEIAKPLMSNVIRVLSDDTINKIAAGEVIENPASVVKELIDNSLDAGATEITIEIKGGGRQLIRVSDNGHGMSKDNALLSLERHATSKIGDVNDIDSLSSMGFRGEAIPSIASISKFTLLTSTDGSVGTLIIVDGGTIASCSSGARSQGTTTEVKNLFFNVPVRKKFQRSPALDAQDTQQMVTRLSLANPDVGFHLLHNQKTLLRTAPESGLATRIADVMGRDFLSGLKEIDAESGQLHLRGYIGKGSFTRQNRTGQILIVNGRPVQAPVISFGVKEGYGTRIPPHRHPVFVLHLNLPNDWIDVNVHPQKREVRFRRQGELRAFVVNSVQGCWTEEAPVAVSMPTWEPTPWGPPVQPPIQSPYRQETLFPVEHQQTAGSGHRVIGLFHRYLIVNQQDETLALVDQRLAKSRIDFEKLCQNESEPEIQQLLIPITIQFPPSDAAHIKSELPSLLRLGIDVQDLGQESFAVNGIPSTVKQEDVRSLLQEIATTLSESDQLASRARQIQLAKLIARSGSQRISTVFEGQHLYEQLMNCEVPSECPFGQSIWIRLSPEYIQTLFKEKIYEPSIQT